MATGKGCVRFCALTAVIGLAAPGAEADLVSHWTLDGTLDDAGPAANHGTFQGDVAPTFVEGQDGTIDGAVALDGLDDLITATPAAGLPIYAQPAYSVALWVKGLPQVDRRVFAEASTAANQPLLNLGTHSGGANGQVDIYIRTAGNVAIVNHRRSAREAFDGSWHHIAWVDDNGQAVLYIDGIRDATDFSYAKPAIDFNTTTIGGIRRASPSHFFAGEIDDVRLYDHALSEEEVKDLLPPPDACPAQGDTHCDVLLVEGPLDLSPGRYTATAIDAEDESGDVIQYLFKAERAGGPPLTAGPQAAGAAAFDLGEGAWMVSVTVDDDLFCEDSAPDATCTREVVVACPATGDTHCADLTVIGPPTGGPGTYTALVANATDESGDLITYTLTASNGVDPPLVRGPQPGTSADFVLTQGEWTVSAAVDDGTACADAAPDALCTAQVTVSCPAEGDTHAQDLAIEEPPQRLPGTYRLTAAATDDSGDPVLYRFTASSAGRPTLVSGPGPLETAAFTLSAGDWTLAVAADDDPGCPDQAADATRSLALAIPAPPPKLVSRWTFDETLDDAEPAANHGTFYGDLAPIYAAGHDGNPLGAVAFDGLDDHVEALQNENLPITAHRAYSVALWVNGGPQVDRRVFSEGQRTSNNPLFNIGTDNTGATGMVDIFIRTDANVTIVPHRKSARPGFDNTWHHLAWVDDDGKAVLYVDGVRDATDFRYRRGQLTLDTTSIGGILRGAASHWFAGSIDEVRVYNHALSLAEVEALVPEPAGCPQAGDTHCGSLQVLGPAGNAAGPWTLTATGAADDSGDPILFTFVAEDRAGRRFQVGPGPAAAADLRLHPGTWTLTLDVDDDIRCRDRAADAGCSVVVTVVEDPNARLISHWKLDGDVQDSAAGGNHGSFAGAPAPAFTADRNRNAGAALDLDGVDDYLLVNRASADLPLFYNFAFSVAMWVKGGPQPDYRVFSESSRALNAPLFNIGTQNGGVTGQVDIFIRNDASTVIVPHVLSTGIAFDETWHHLAWVDSFGEAALYIDGVRDATDFTYARPTAGFTVDTTTLGGILRAAPSHFFRGALDDVRIYNRVLSEQELRELAGLKPPVPRFRRGDGDGNGKVEITDAILNLGYQFLGGARPSCLEALDDDGNGSIDISDPIYSLGYQFLGGPELPAPGARDCGPDPTPDDLGCESYGACD